MADVGAKPTVITFDHQVEVGVKLSKIAASLTLLFAFSAPASACEDGATTCGADGKVYQCRCIYRGSCYWSLTNVSCQNFEGDRADAPRKASASAGERFPMLRILAD